MTFLSELQSLDDWDKELVLERAAIIEFDGNLPRAEAERLALAELTTRGTGREVVHVEVEARGPLDFAKQVAVALGFPGWELNVKAARLVRVWCYTASGELIADWEK